MRRGTEPSERAQPRDGGGGLEKIFQYIFHMCSVNTIRCQCCGTESPRTTNRSKEAVDIYTVVVHRSEAPSHNEAWFIMTNGGMCIVHCIC